MASSSHGSGPGQRHPEQQAAQQYAGTAGQTQQQDHTPRREEQIHREQAAGTPPEGAPPPRDEKAEALRKEQMAASSIGAQVILDFNEAGSLGARGGAGGTIEENTQVRDYYLVSMGLDPVATSGPPPSQEMAEAKQKAADEAAKAAAEGPQLPGKATRVSSLAAGIVSDDVPKPAHIEPQREGEAAHR